jgi:hypothetical protein
MSDHVLFRSETFRVDRAQPLLERAHRARARTTASRPASRCGPRRAEAWAVLLRRLLVAAATLALVSALVFVVVDALADRAALDLGRGASPEALAARRHAARARPAVLDQALGTCRIGHVVRARESARHGPVIARLGRALGPTLCLRAAGLRAGDRGGARGRLRRRRGGAAGSTAGCWPRDRADEHLERDRRGARAAPAGAPPALFPVLGWPLGGDARGAAGFVRAAGAAVGADPARPRSAALPGVFVRELAAPHLEGLRARGFGEPRIAGHVLRAALGPVLARVSARLPQLVLGSVVVEHLFNVPGDRRAAARRGPRRRPRARPRHRASSSRPRRSRARRVCDLLVHALDPRTRPAAEAVR